MIARVKDSFCGWYGCHDNGKPGVTFKRAGDPPFEVADEEGREMMNKGVLEEVAPDPATMKEPKNKNVKKFDKVVNPEPVPPELSIVEPE